MCRYGLLRRGTACLGQGGYPLSTAWRRLGRLDLAYEVDAGLERSIAFLPLSRAHLTWVLVDELSSLDLTEQFASVTTDTVVVDLCNLDLALWVEEECTTVSLTRLFAEDTHSVGELEGHISEHRILYTCDRIRSVSPCLVNKVGVGANRIDIYTESLELFVVVS